MIVVGCWLLDIQDVSHRRITKPGKLIEWQEVLSVRSKQPKPVPGDIGNLNCRSACARQRQSPRSARLSSLDVAELFATEIVIVGKFDFGLQPKLGLAISAIGVDMNSRLLSGKEI